MTQDQPATREATWQKVIRLLRWDKPAGRLILMIPALWAVFLAAKGTPPLPLVGVIILGTLATSAAGCVVNDLWDKDIDPQVARTKTRPLASRALSVKVGIIIFAIALLCAAILAFYLKPLSFILCVVAVPFIVLYPLAKRVFPVPQLVLSLAWGFAVLISWTAVTGEIEPATWILWGATVAWTMGFDTGYALSDREDDLKVGINSSAIFFGKYTPGAIAIFYVITAGLMTYLGLELALSWAFWVSLALATVGWGWQYLKLRQPKIPRSVYGKVLGQNVWLGFILLAGMIVGYLV
ncbi:4-hydroxybenzoate solanesyltransferase [Waterburya agarophytonicola K14]|uniref:4-hydroxybenzoate solanesyltransferase n=1 Tax=Waterburya agarophytonicola KI4 TaxID=2874699 RepID=A0A964BQ15_9CYAN|nr:4-hydroxybenzoate solanesyltransferase [Waterburya agarophytonicola]MCC0177189.1 4-hydroxybenzoate solanesyltransferase [Waterburya agarophytonicola KI4]